MRKPKDFDWFATLFDIKNLNDSPFNSAWKNFGISLTHKNAPTAVCITMGGETIDSRRSESAKFDAVPKEATAAATNGNYPATLGQVVVKAAADFSRSLREHSYAVDDPFKYAGEVMRGIENTPG